MNSVVSALQTLKQMPAEACGALIRQRVDGTMAGAVLAERGRVCWAVSHDAPRRLTDVLVAEGENLTHQQINEIVATCRRDQTPLAETLLARGLVSLPVLHRALLHHTCESFDRLLRDDAAPWSWVEHARYGYNPILTFSPVEVLAGVQAIVNPARAHRAASRLRVTLGPAQRGLAIERAHGRKLPLAQIGCTNLELSTLQDLAAQADEVAILGATVGVEIAVMDLGDQACASWVEDDVLFVLLCAGDMAFNRMLAHTALLSVNH